MKSNARLHIISFWVVAALLGVIVCVVLSWGIFIYEFDTRATINDSGRHKDDPYVIQSGVDGMLMAMLNLAPSPANASARKYQVRRNVVRTRLTFYAQFKVSKPDLKAWIAASAPLKGKAYSAKLQDVQSISLPPPPMAKQAEVNLDNRNGSVEIIIKFGQ